jgi:hypothetical protein
MRLRIYVAVRGKNQTTSTSSSETGHPNPPDLRFTSIDALLYGQLMGTVNFKTEKVFADL